MEFAIALLLVIVLRPVLAPLFHLFIKMARWTLVLLALLFVFEYVRWRLGA